MSIEVRPQEPATYVVDVDKAHDMAIAGDKLRTQAVISRGAAEIIQQAMDDRTPGSTTRKVNNTLNEISKLHQAKINSGDKPTPQEQMQFDQANLASHIAMDHSDQWSMLEDAKANAKKLDDSADKIEDIVAEAHDDFNFRKVA